MVESCLEYALVLGPIINTVEKEKENLPKASLEGEPLKDGSSRLWGHFFIPVGEVVHEICTLVQRVPGPSNRCGLR